MVTERFAERTPGTTHDLVDLGRRLSTLKGPDKVGPHDLKRYDSISAARTALSIGLVNVIRLVCAGPLPDRRSSLIDQHIGYVRHRIHRKVVNQDTVRRDVLDSRQHRVGLAVLPCPSASHCSSALLTSCPFPDRYAMRRPPGSPLMTSEPRLPDAGEPNSPTAGTVFGAWARWATGAVAERTPSEMVQSTKPVVFPRHAAGRRRSWG